MFKQCVSTVLVIALFAIVFAQPMAGAFPRPPQEQVDELEGIGIVENLGLTVPSDIKITTDKGETIELGQLFHQGKPTVLIMAYYQCPMLCNLVLNGMSESMEKLEWDAGDKFRVLTVSINPNESVDLASSKKANYLSEFTKRSGREFNPDGWIFAIAEENESRRLADAVGFQYKLDSASGEYAHSAAAFVLTEDGVISRYLYGINFESHTLKLALLEASEGKIGSTLEKIVLYCYRYDPSAGGYVVFATNVMKLGGAVFVLIIGTIIGTLWMRERSRARKENLQSPQANPVS